jgi:hypothetical protein
MRRLSMIAALAATLACAAFAQNDTPAKVGPSPTSGADMGFFPPRPDVALTSPAPATQLPRAPAAPAPAQLPPRTATPAAPGAQSTAVADPGEILRRTEDDLDRADREARLERDRALRTPPPITGAFTGLTDERDR